MSRPDGALNQPPPLVEFNAFRSDRALVDACARYGLTQRFGPVEILGTLAGSARAQEWAALANAQPPQLHTHDRYGNRIDEVEYHPYYHELMRVATQFGLHATPWTTDDPLAHTERASKFYVWGQVEAGHGCPISMTYAGVPPLRLEPQLAAVWEPKLAARDYDPQLQPIEQKYSALCGMAMTEKQGGSDVRANATQAVSAGAGAWGEAYRLTGHKWFCSAPMSDAFFVLAQRPAGVTCYFMPRVLPDGSRNRIFIQRLKEKLGNRSNASSEIELDAAWAIRVGGEGDGLRTILEMVNFTRLDCINGSASLMRAAAVQALHHATYRRAFGKTLIEQPLMQNVLADLAIESEAAMLFMLRMASAVDGAARDPREAAVKRLGTAVGKYYICKRAPVVAGEALECLGGNGYIEEFANARLYREAPLNSIWEGSGNINALDVLRILRKQPETLEAFHAEIEPALHDARVQSVLSDLHARLQAADEAQARAVCERLALLWQAALLAADPANPCAELFLASRFGAAWRGTLGTLPATSTLKTIVQRASPHQSVEYSNR